MTKHQTTFDRIVSVNLGSRSYDIVINEGGTRHAGSLLAEWLKADTAKGIRVLLISDSAVYKEHGRAVEKSLQAAGADVRSTIVPSGESSKSHTHTQALYDQLVDMTADRKTIVVAVGGGVTGDLAGFVAATYARGLRFVQVPTTLLAQVDSSVGGKTAINVAAGKNLVGAFYQPALVLADTDVLATLAPRELRCGYAEVIKYGILGDAAFFDWCEAHGRDVLALEPDAITRAVTTSVEAKARIVAEDERETSGARALLNLGHTFGHALEAETGYSDRLLHGEAVATGMVLAARYSARKGYLAQADAERIASAIAAAGLPAELSSLGLKCDGKALTAHMLHDKKMDAGTLPFILLRGIGEAFLDRAVDLADVAEFLDGELRGT